MKTDSGFAPNPFGGVCTLACCKPQIRRMANVGDWVIGTAPSPNNRKLMYAMRVSRALTFDLYFNDPAYSCKKNSPDNPRGDNIYRPTSHRRLEQVPNPAHDQRHIQRDLSVNLVLISDHFYYFGRQAPELPSQFGPLIHSTQGRKRIRAEENSAQHELFLSLICWLEKNYSPGILGEPTSERIVCFPPDEDEGEE